MKETEEKLQLLGPWGATDAESYCCCCCNIKQVWLDRYENSSKEISQVIVVDVIEPSSSPLLLLTGVVADPTTKIRKQKEMTVAATITILALLLFSFRTANDGLWLDLLASDGLSWWMG